MTNSQRVTDGPLVIALDSSTTSTKAIVVDSKGNVWHTAKREVEMFTPAMDFYEHNPLQWWETSRDAIAEVCSKLDARDRDRVAAIGITHQRESFAPFDKNGMPLRNGILWLDSRATEQIRRYGTKRVHELSGKPAGVTPGIYKMAWVKEHEPEVWEKAYKIVDVLGYITYHLTGRWASGQAAADSLGLFDIQKRDWAPELLDIAGVRRDQMSDLVEPSYEIAPLRKQLAEGWGLKEVPVIAGLGDGQAAGIGAAAVNPEIGFLNMGTAVNAGVESSTYKCDDAFRTHVSGIPGNYVFEVLQSSGSYLAGWFRGALGNPELGNKPDPELEAAATAVAPGADGLITLPYWNAVQSPYWDSVARGAVVGWRGTHGRAHMYRSILESIGFEMRLNLNFLEAGTGVKLEGLRAMGGGTRSPLWRQLMADITGLPITVCVEDEISALGAAVLAMASTGIYGEHDVRNTAINMARFGETIEPNMDLFERYQEVAAIQRELYPNLKNTFEKLYELSLKYPQENE